MTHTDKRRGFTLVEMLVVISIIVVLVAILFPVIASAREKSRQTQCRTNLMHMVSALQEYKRQYHRYPPRPAYNADEEIYTGGFSALYPDFVDNYNDFICPDDKAIAGREQDARDRRYCSYNGRINLAEDMSASNPWEFAVDSDTGNQMITYNYHGYDELGWDRDTPLAPPADPTPAWLDRGWKYYPRLMNIYAPEYTMVTHCTFHRAFYSKESEQRDLIIQLSSDTDSIVVKNWQEAGGGASLFEKQQN